MSMKASSALRFVWGYIQLILLPSMWFK
jgi:hypothetical protein